MTDKILQDGVVQVVNDQPEQVDRLRGLGLPPDFNAAEAASWRRFIPRRMPWREVASFEAEITRLEQRHRDIEAERGELSTRLAGAPDRDLEEAAKWERGGRRGTAPEPSRPALEVDLARCSHELAALSRAMDGVSGERAAYVEKHRGRLVKDARQSAEKALEHSTRLLGELEDARAELVEARRLEVWAGLYPSEATGREPSWVHLGGGLRRVSEALGITSLLAVEQVFAALREDTTWIASAASPEQRAKLGPQQPVSQEQRERARDRAIEDKHAVRRQLAQDRRAGELEAMRGQL